MQPAAIQHSDESCALKQVAGARDAPLVAANKLAKGNCRWRGPTNGVAQAGCHLVSTHARLARAQHPLLSAAHSTGVSYVSICTHTLAEISGLRITGIAYIPSLCWQQCKLHANTCATRQDRACPQTEKSDMLTRSSPRVTSARPGDCLMELNRRCARCTIATFFA